MTRLKNKGASPTSPNSGRTAKAEMIATSNAVCRCGEKYLRTKCLSSLNTLRSVGSLRSQLRVLARFGSDRARNIATQSCQGAAMGRGQRLEVLALHRLARRGTSGSRGAAGVITDDPDRILEHRLAADRIEALHFDGHHVNRGEIRKLYRRHFGSP